MSYRSIPSHLGCTRDTQGTMQHVMLCICVCTILHVESDVSAVSRVYWSYYKRKPNISRQAGESRVKCLRWVFSPHRRRVHLAAAPSSDISIAFIAFSSLVSSKCLIWSKWSRQFVFHQIVSSTAVSVHLGWQSGLYNFDALTDTSLLTHQLTLQPWTAHRLRLPLHSSTVNFYTRTSLSSDNGFLCCPIFFFCCFHLLHLCSGPISLLTPQLLSALQADITAACWESHFWHFPNVSRASTLAAAGKYHFRAP